MNNKDERQHYVSCVLLERFRHSGKPLECFDLKTQEWKPRSVEKVCSAPGYNQLLLSSDVNNTIEDSFSKVESRLPKTLRALEHACTQPKTELPKNIYENWCLYCAFLKRTSLFAKPGAVVSFLAQLNMELEKNSYYLFRELGVPQDQINKFREGFAAGGRLIIESENVIQLVYRIQFERMLKLDFTEFVNCEWTISESPIELPMSDIGLVQIQLIGHKAVQYLLPIGPKMVLDGIFYHDLEKNSPQPNIAGHRLNKAEAEYRFSVLCMSSVNEIIFSTRCSDIKARLEHARTMGVSFNKIVNPQVGLSAGLKNCDLKYRLQMVSVDEYVRFIHSFIQPPHLQAPRI
jgi:hypothetical protein